MPLGQVSAEETKAPVSLKFIVVGGNVAGLATAYALRKAGHSVVVVEKGDGTSQSIGGLRSPPNMTRILNQWGFASELEKISNKCTTFRMRNGGSGEPIGSMIMTESFLVHLLADFLFVRHADIHTLLYEHAKEIGVKFLFSSEVTRADPEEVSVTLKNGDQLRADVVVGADGYDSLLRHIVTGEPELDPSDVSEKKLWAMFNIPADVLRNDEELRNLADPLIWTLWLGDGFVLSGNLLAGGEEFTVSLVYDYHLPLQDGDEEWQQQTSLEQYQLNLSKFDSSALKILKQAKFISAKICRVRPHMETLVSDNARIVLVGEAAHPTLPSGHQTTSMAMEDAQTLGKLFTRIQNRDQVPQFLSAYEEIRQPRVSSIQIYEVQQQGMLTAPTGPIMEERDKAMRKALAYDDWEHMDEDTFNTVWAKEVEIVTHDATEQVEDWWTQWGGYFDKSNGHRKSMEVPSYVSISVS